MRRDVRRPFTLVKVGFSYPCLYVLTGMPAGRALRAGVRAGARVRGARTGDCGPYLVATVATLGFAQVGGGVRVLTGARGRLR